MRLGLLFLPHWPSVGIARVKRAAPVGSDLHNGSSYNGQYRKLHCAIPAKGVCGGGQQLPSEDKPPLGQGRPSRCRHRRRLPNWSKPPNWDNPPNRDRPDSTNCRPNNSWLRLAKREAGCCASAQVLNGSRAANKTCRLRRDRTWTPPLAVTPTTTTKPAAITPAAPTATNTTSRATAINTTSRATENKPERSLK